MAATVNGVQPIDAAAGYFSTGRAADHAAAGRFSAAGGSRGPGGAADITDDVAADGTVGQPQDICTPGHRSHVAAAGPQQLRIGGVAATGSGRNAAAAADGRLDKGASASWLSG